MADNPQTIDEALAPAQALLVNAACDRFEAAWKATRPDEKGPRIEDYVSSGTGPQQVGLLRHLILLDIDYRRLRGDRLAPADYEARFSGLSHRALQEALGKSPGNEAAPQQPAEKNGDRGQGQSTLDLPSFRPQMRAGRYVVRKFHARGGVGEVWMAQDAEIGRVVAVKRLRPQKEALKERFLVEAQITGQLEHPGIVPVHDLGIDEEGRPFYVMSFIEGQTFKDAIEEYHAGPAPTSEPREVQAARLLENFVKICHAVAYAHHRGVVHRDLKPDNVMLGPFGEVLVLDWGLAKLCGQVEPSRNESLVRASYSSGSSATEHGTILGSPGYMAPELADGKAPDADERTDVYLLGATLYHILTGQAPRRGSSRDEMLELARTVQPAPPRWVKKDIPKALEAICLKAMDQRKDRRYASALELAKDMERYLAGAQVSAYREPLLIRVGRWCKRHRQLLGRLITGAVVLTVIAVGALLVRDALNKQEQTRLKADQDVRAAKDSAEAERREADRLRRRLRVLDHIKEFRRLADERQFRSASTTLAGQAAVFYDAERSQQIGEKAIALADELLLETKELGMKTEVDTLQQELYALLMLVIQEENLALQNADKAKVLLARAEALVSLGGPSRSYFRILAHCHRTLGEAQRAAQDDRDAKATLPTALDHFLEGEECRIRAGLPAELGEGRLAWRANAELLGQAVLHYREAVRMEPDNFWYHLQLGRCYLSIGMPREALASLDTCVALHKDKPWGYSARGLARGLVGRLAEGEADLDRALEIDPEFRLARLHRGFLAFLGQKDDDAQADFAAVLELPAERRLVEAFYYRGQLHMTKGDYKDALADFDRLAKETPTFRPVYLLRAQVHFLRDEDRLGLDDLTTFINLGGPKPLDPKDPQLPALRGRLLLQLVPKWKPSREVYVAKMKVVQSELEKARKAGVHSAEFFDDLGSVAQHLEQWNTALGAYNQALEQAPMQNLAVKICTKRGWINAQYLEPRQYNRAAEDFKIAIRLDPAYADAHAGLGYVQAFQGLPAEANREALLALKKVPDHYLLLHNVACIYAQLSQVDKPGAKLHQDQAVDLLQRSVELCQRKGDRDNELGYIRQEPLLIKVLKDHPDFKKLLEGKGP